MSRPIDLETWRGVREYLGFAAADVAAYLGISEESLAVMESGAMPFGPVVSVALGRLYGIANPLGDTIGPLEGILAEKVRGLPQSDKDELSAFAAYLAARKKAKVPRGKKD